MTGRVQTYHQQRAWGWIVGDDGARYFAHRTDVAGKLLPQVGTLVEFQVARTSRGLRAVKVRRVETAAPAVR